MNTIAPLVVDRKDGLIYPMGDYSQEKEKLGYIITAVMGISGNSDHHPATPAKNKKNLGNQDKTASKLDWRHPAESHPTFIGIF